MQSILVGCDPEVFVKQGNKFLSAYGLIKGSKEHPFPVRNGAVQVDGMALEFNTYPASSANEFIINVEDVYAQLCAMVPEYQVVACPVADFDPQYMKEQPAEALELGCDPDYNGWSMNANGKPNGDRPFRTASGHVHIGWTKDADIQSAEHFYAAGAVARQMDFFLGLPSIAYDKDNRRRELYGKAGCFRPKSYGCEYRTLSNAWLNSRTTMEWVFNAIQSGMHRLMSGDALFEKHGDIQEIINSSDWKKAKKIIDKEGLAIPHV